MKSPQTSVAIAELVEDLQCIARAVVFTEGHAQNSISLCKKNVDSIATINVLKVKPTLKNFISK
ncbi:hypothetical protein M2326_001302 [Flavobacterium sp. 7A]|nr:hypothetical protein [Flavobacterium sp. 7A]